VEVIWNGPPDPFQKSALADNWNAVRGCPTELDSAVKAMTENPQDRAAQTAKLYESFGGKMESVYWFPTGGEYNGMIIAQIPDDVSMEALTLMVRAQGSLAGNGQSFPLMTSEEFKAAMEKAKSVKTGYTPPTATKQ
jgi:uncharacterized protein with GYD domain